MIVYYCYQLPFWRKYIVEYFRSETLLIRTILPSDAQPICDEELAQGWHPSLEKYLSRVRDFNTGKSIALIAEYNGCIAGYINVYPNATLGAFAHKGYCEIVDFAVLENISERVLAQNSWM